MAQNKDVETLKNIDVHNIMDSFQGFIKTGIIMHAVDLDIFSKIENSDGNKALLTTLAKDVDVLPRHLERFLNVCASLGLVVKSENENGGVFYTNTNESKAFLTSDSSLSVIPIIRNGRYLVPNFAVKMLNEASAAEAPNAAMFYGMLGSSKEPFSHFQEGMTSSLKTAQVILEQIDFTPYSNVVDLGGGTGYLANYVKQRNPKAKVTLAEIPMAIQLAKEDPDTASAGIEFQEADFFDPSTLPTGADLYILAHILHNWSDDTCKVILKNVRSALQQGPSAHVIVLDKHLSPDKTQGPMLSDMMMLNMAVDGRERSKEEIQQLLDSEGFKVEQVFTSDSSLFYDAILATKV